MHSDSTLTPSSTDWLIERVALTGSTNADLMARFNAESASLRPTLRALTSPIGWTEAQVLFKPVVRVAAEQTAGRGRQGRRWVSTPGQSLLFSIAVVLPLPIGALSGLSLAAGTAVLAGLRKLPLSDPSLLALKWPNDIELGDAKLGGILIETAASSAHASAVVIGVGLNLRGQPVLAQAVEAASETTAAAAAPLPSALPDALPPSRPAAALTTILDRPEWAVAPVISDTPIADELAEHTLAAILDAFADMFATFSKGGFRAFRERWWADHRFAKQCVSILDGGREQLRGQAVGVDDWGRLLIETPDRIGQPHAIASGDLSMRAATAAGTSPAAAPTPSSAAAST